MCGAQTRCPGDAVASSRSAAASSQGGGHGLLDEHVLAGAQRRVGQRPVLVHAREHEHEIDVVALDHGLGSGQPGVDAEPPAGCAALALVDVVDRRDARSAGRREPLDHPHVRAVEHAPKAQHADPDGALVHGRDASTALESGPLGSPSLTGRGDRSS